MNTTPKNTFTRRYGNVITVAFWAAALLSHAFLLPKFIRDMTGKH